MNTQSPNNKLMNKIIEYKNNGMSKYLNIKIYEYKNN